MKSPLTINYAAFDDALKLALSAKQPGDEVVLTVRASVTANSDESVDLDLEEITLDKEASSDGEDEVEDEAMESEEDMPAMVVAIAKKPKK